MQRLSPYIRFAIDQRLDAAWILEERIIFDYELLYIKDGEVRITVEDTTYHAQPGDVFLFRPNRRHSMKPISPQGFQQPHLHFDLVWQEDSGQAFISFKSYQQMTDEERQMIRTDILPEMGVDLPDKLQVFDKDMFEQLLFDVIYEFENQLPFSELITQGTFLRLWAFILRQQIWHGNAEGVPRTSLMLDIRNFLNSNTSQTIYLDDVAHHFGVSKYHLIRSFKEMFGLSPIHYHQHCRLEKAKNVIIYTNIPITQIANDFGFDSVSAFTRAFKNNYGESPSAFRRGFLKFE